MDKKKAIRGVWAGSAGGGRGRRGVSPLCARAVDAGQNERSSGTVLDLSRAKKKQDCRCGLRAWQRRWFAERAGACRVEKRRWVCKWVVGACGGEKSGEKPQAVRKDAALAPSLAQKRTIIKKKSKKQVKKKRTNTKKMEDKTTLLIYPRGGRGKRAVWPTHSPLRTMFCLCHS